MCESDSRFAGRRWRAAPDEGRRDATNSRNRRMPKFSAKLPLLYPDLPLLDRFAAARKSGFTGVEYMSPYEETKGDLVARLRDNGLAQVLFNVPAGNWGGG